MLNLRSLFLAQYSLRNHIHFSICLLYISTWMGQRHLMFIGSKIKLVLTLSQSPPLPYSLPQLLAVFIHQSPKLESWKSSFTPVFSLTLAIYLGSLSNQSLESDNFASSTLSFYLLPPFLEKILLAR